MTDLYGSTQRAFQDQFDTRRLADRVGQIIIHPDICDIDRDFIESRDMFWLATVDHEGRPTVSYKGGAPGFVRVLDAHTIAFPCYDGNGMFFSMGNVLDNPQVGLLFIDFEHQRRMRVNGTASVNPADALLGSYPEAQFIVRVTATAIFPNCPRYIHNLELVERSRFVPRAGVETPEPAWKSADWARDVVPPKP